MRGYYGRLDTMNPSAEYTTLVIYRYLYTSAGLDVTMNYQENVHTDWLRHAERSRFKAEEKYRTKFTFNF